jgi:malate/lactate dehydrogenase
MKNDKPKVVIVGAGETGSLAAAIAHQLDKTEKEIILIDAELKNSGEYMNHPIPILPSPMFETAFRKKKECEGHQYTKRENGKWLCRHCERDMKANKQK